MALYKRRRSKERPVSVYTGSSSPVLVSYKNQYSTSQPASPFSDESLNAILTNAYVADSTCISEESGCALDTTLTSSCNTQSENLDIEVSGHAAAHALLRYYLFLPSCVITTHEMHPSLPYSG